MPTMEEMMEEFVWEDEMLRIGAERFIAQIASTKSKINRDGKRVPVRDESNTLYGVKLLNSVAYDLYEVLHSFVQRTLVTNNISDIQRLLNTIDLRIAAYLATKTTIDGISKSESQTAIARRISQKIEDQIRFTVFESESPGLYKTLIGSMKERGTNNYRHKRTVLAMADNKRVDSEGNPHLRWVSWPPNLQVRLGVFLIDALIEVTSDYNDKGELIPDSGLVTRKRIRTNNKGNRQYFIVGTEKTLQFINSDISDNLYCQPEFTPTLCEPRPWSNPTDGGYWDSRLRDKQPLVGYNTKLGKRWLHTKVKNANMPKVYKAINALQAVQWEINPFVLDVLEQEWKVPHGIGLPEKQTMTPPPCPYNIPQQKNFETRDQFSVVKKTFWASLAPEQSSVLQTWFAEAREIYTQDRERVSQWLQLDKTMKLARKLLGKKKFHFVYTLCSRSRVYVCGTAISLQSNKISKALLRFHNGEVLTNVGLIHTALYTAVCYGIDKESISTQLEWVRNNMDNIIACWRDPGSTREFWGEADKPWLFLACVSEIAPLCLKYRAGEDISNELTKLPLIQDGSCNGMQHYSAILLDPVGAATVNLSDAEKPGDIYGEVADQTIRTLQSIIKSGVYGLALDLSNKFINSGIINRDLAKKPTMVLPYSGTKAGSLKKLKKDLKALKHPFGHKERTGEFRQGKDGTQIPSTTGGVDEAAGWINKHLWDSLDRTIIAAKEAMAFLRATAGKIASFNRHIEWVTMVGFPVLQDYRQLKVHEIPLKLMSGVKMKPIIKEEEDDINVYKSRNSMPPNFVHSLDATHLILSVCEGVDKGITNFGVIHDGLGTTAGQTALWHTIIRHEFVRMYSHNVLQNWLEQQYYYHPDLIDILPKLEEYGEIRDFDIKEVAKSTFFFGGMPDQKLTNDFLFTK